MARYFMDIIRTPLTLLTLLLLTACGGGNSSSPDNTPPAEITFPEHLPKVNPNLSQEDQSGIWISYRVHNTKIRNLNGEKSIQGEVTEVAHEMAIINHSEDDFYTLQFCTTTEFYERYDQGYETLENGYSYIYSGYENGSDTGSTGRINVTFLNNNEMYGLGHKKTPYVYGGQEVIEEETIEFFAIKISDEVNFNESNDITYISDIESQSGEISDTSPVCIGIYERKIKIHTDDIVTYENHDKHLMLADHNASGFDLYKADGGAFGVMDQKLVGGWYYRRLIESQCNITDEECLNRHKLELNILKNDNSGISFSAHLNSSDGDFLDAEVSVIIHPFEAAPDTQE